MLHSYHDIELSQYTKKLPLPMIYPFFYNNSSRKLNIERARVMEMKKRIERIENRLNKMIEWLERGNEQYSKKDFKEELDRMLEAVDEALWCEIITDEEYTTLKNIIIHKTIKYV